MMVRVSIVSFVLAGLVGIGRVEGQPAGSPRDTARATIGAATITIDYGRPYKRGRSIMGSLVPFGQVWRTGANKATHLVTDKSLMFGALMVPPGTYTLYTVPDQTSWKLIINKQTGQWGTSYSADQDLGRVEMTVASLPAVVEQFTIKIVPQGNGGTLRFEWERTAATVPFMIH
jgi:hypothetical protein